MVPAVPVCAQAGWAGEEFQFRLGGPTEVVAELEMSSPGPDWGEAGREARYSARAAGLEVADVRFREFRAGDPYFPALANASILYARANTIGGFRDIPPGLLLRAARRKRPAAASLHLHRLE